MKLDEDITAQPGSASTSACVGAAPSLGAVWLDSWLCSWELPHKTVSEGGGLGTWRNPIASSRAVSGHVVLLLAVILGWEHWLWE